MNISNMPSPKNIWLLVFSVIALLTFFPLFFTGFATADDLHYYLTTRRGMVFEDSNMLARIAGRFYFLLVRPVYSLPYVFDNMAVTKIFQIVPILLCMLVFAKLVDFSTRIRNLAALWFLLFLVTMQISRHTSLFVAYPFYFSFSFLLLLLAFYQLMLFFRSDKRSHIIASVLLFFIALLFYETYILFLIFAGVSILYNSLGRPGSLFNRLHRAFLLFLPFLVAGVLYLTAYLVFRHYFPSQYLGTSLSEKHIGIGNFFNALWKLSLSAWPLVVYENSHNIFWERTNTVAGYSPVVLNLILSARVEWLVKGILAGFTGWYVLRLFSEIGLSQVMRITLMSVLLIFLPHIPLALTEKYIYYTREGGMIGYVTTYFSIFGTMLLISVWLAYLFSIFNKSKIISYICTSLVAFSIFICTVITSYSNDVIASDIRQANLRFLALDELIKTDEFKSIPHHSPFYAKELWTNNSYSAASLTEQDFNWYEYFEARMGITYPVGREDSIFLKYSKTVPQVPYYLTMRQADKSQDIALVLARMEPLKQTDSLVNHYADRALILFYSSYKTFTISFSIKDDQWNLVKGLMVNHIYRDIPAGRKIEFTVQNTKLGSPSTSFIIQCPGIDLRSIIISNTINRDNLIFYL